MDWFQITLYTRALINVIKRTKNEINIWNLSKIIISLHPEPIQKCSGQIFSYVEYCTKNVHHHFVSLFLLILTPNIFISLQSSHFKIHIDIHPSNMGEKLVYYHLYHEEASFYLQVYTQLFNRNFLIFNTNKIFIHLGLRS